jgi:peptidyl-prolyl cis-trans isomerase C
MPSRVKCGGRWIFVLVSLGVLWVGRSPVSAQDAAPERKVAVRVNGQPIYEDQIQAEVDRNLKALKKFGARNNDDAVIKQLRLKVLNQAVGDLLVNQECKKLTVDNMDEKIDQKVKELEDKFGAGPGMERYLKMRRTTLDQLRESLKARVQMDEYLKGQGVKEPNIPEDRIREMYDTDPQSFSREETILVSHVLIPVKKPEEKESARQKAEEVRKEILAGKDFAEMAKEHSACGKSASRGGDLGHVKKGFMPAEFDAVAFALEPGVVSELVESKFGYHIIKVSEKSPAGIVPYEQVRDFLLKYLQDEEAKKLLESHVQDLWKKAQIEIVTE